MVKEGQAKAVKEWSIPENRKQLQWFLGFANCYRWFIRDFSQMVTPLISPTSPLVRFHWN